MKIVFSTLFTLFRLIVSAQTNVTIDKELTNNGVILFVTNNEYCPISIQFNMKLENMENVSGPKNTFVIPAQAQKFKVMELNAIDLRQKRSYSYDYLVNYGNINQAQYDTAFAYELPYRKGKDVLVFQGYNGSFSHQNENALDFAFPNGSEILSARDGIVIKVVQNFTVSCLEEACKQNNYILIYHNDGTFASYAHIQFNGARVKEGDTVKAGDLIALSGNVGYTNGPHLHFACYFPTVEREKTIMTKFKAEDGQTLKYLQEKQSYRKNY